MALYSIESDLSAVYRVENDLGELLLRQGHFDSAERHLRTALIGSNELGIDRRGRGYILANLGEVNLRTGRSVEAEGYLKQALDAGRTVGERVVVANAHALLGQLEELKGSPSGADDNFLAAIRLLEDLEMPDRLRDCHMEYAEVLSHRGEITAAAGHWKTAAEIGKLISTHGGLEGATTGTAGGRSVGMAREISAASS